MKLEVLFDYACPFCLRGYHMLQELLPEHPALAVEWRPCEAHPRPQRYGRHSDLCARAMYIALRQGVEVTAVHDRLYKAALTDRLDIEDASVVAGALADLVDRALLHMELLTDVYEDALAANNHATWTQHRFDAVPSLVLGDRSLGSVEGVGLSPDKIRAFLNGSLTD